MRRVIGRIGYATRKVYQLTGEHDRERNVPCSNATESRYGLFGTDLGSSFEHDGRLWFLFGDTIAQFQAYNDWRPDSADSISYTTDIDPERGVSLTFITAPDGKYLSPRITPDVPRGPFNVPLEGFSANGNMYVFFSTDSDVNAPGGVRMGRSILTRATDPEQAQFSMLYTLSDFREGGKFVNVSVSIVDNALFPGLPQEAGQGLVMFGSGAYRASNPYLAWLPLDAVEHRARVLYFSGDATHPAWSPHERDAMKLVEHPQIGELCVRHLPEIEGWLMLYNAGSPRGINIRTAPTPWGPWSEPGVLFDPGCDGGYGHFIHASWRENGHADAVHDPDRENEWGGEYGPYLISRFTRRERDEVIIYFVMSTWNPYNTVLMRARLRLDPWRGWYTLGGATFPAGAGVASASRGPEQLEVWAIDNTGTVRGNWFDQTWRGWYTLAGATFSPGAAITAVSRGPNQLEVWAIDNTGTVRGNWFDQTWRGWYSLVDNRRAEEGQTSLSAGAALTSVTRTPQTMSLVTVANNGVAEVESFVGGWAKWAELGGASFPAACPLSSVSRHDGRMEVWAVDVTGTLRGNWFDIS